MIIKKNTVIPVFILLILFTSLFVSIVSIAQMPDKIMGGKDIYVLTSSTDKNPLRSNLDINIAYGLENMSYVESVSPEIFVFTTIANKAITIRGVIFSKLLSLEGGKIIEGEMPHDYGDALVGYRAQKILNLKIGEKLTIRGGFASSLAVINITGIYKSDSPTDDEIIVDLSTARKLAGIGNDEVSIIRIKSENQVMLKKFMDPKSPKFTVNLNVTSESYIGESINVSAKIKNMGINVGNCDLTLFWNGREIKYSNISVYTEKIVSLEIKAPKIPGNYTLKATVSNSLLHYTSSVNIEVKKRPIFVHGPINIIENTYSIFYAYSIHQESLENLTLEIRGESYSSLFTGNSPLKIKISRCGNYTLVFSKEGYQTACIEVKVYKKVPLKELATIKNLYNGTIILPRGEKIEIETDGKIYFSIDNSSLVEKSGNIPIPQYLKGMHKVNITVIKDTMLGWQNFDLLIVENYNPEVISLHPSEKAYYGETVSFQIRDKLPIKNVSVYYENKRKDYRVNQKLGMRENYTFNVTVTLNSSEEIRIFFSDILGKVYNASFKFHLIYQKDVIPPEIIVPDEIEIWGGNSTIIRAEDNVALDFLSVFIFGRYFNTTSTAISIPTIFWNGSVPCFIPPGAYVGKVLARDVSNNTNSTTFMLIVNNYNEKNPPILSGPSLANLSDSPAVYHGYDNAGISRLVCYENSTVIAESTNSTLIIYPNQISSGLHIVIIVGEDVNGNKATMSAKIFKNYHDSKIPEIILKTPVIQSGSFVMIEAEDNVEMKSLRVRFPFLEKVFQSKSLVRIPTMQVEEENVTYLPEGNYTLEIWAIDIFENVNHTFMEFRVDNSNDVSPPIILGPSFADLKKESPVYRAFDNVEVKRIFLQYGNSVIAEGKNELLINLTELPPTLVGTIILKVVAEDINGNFASRSIILQVPDVILPEIIVPDEIEIWGGNSTIIRAEDNVALDFLSVFIFGRYFNTTSTAISIPTIFWNGSVPCFIPPGAYVGKVLARDVSNNTNSTTFMLIVNNYNEKNPPIISGPEFYTLGFNFSCEYRAWDNSFVRRMWVMEENKKIKIVYGNSLEIGYENLGEGYHNVTIYAEDIYGNVNMMNATLFCEYGPKPKVTIYLSQEEITVDTQPLLSITLQNSDRRGYYNLTINIDGRMVAWKWIFLHPHEIKNLYIALPKMPAGTHTITVADQEVKIKVVEVKENLPVDTILKYAKNLKLSGSRDVIYRGFEISEGNVVLTFTSLILITMVLVFLGMYYSSLKGMKVSTIGIIRAIGGSNKDIQKFLWRDVMKYLVPSVVGGIFLGYIITLLLNNIGILQAFGHRLIISPSILQLLQLLLLSLLFLFVSTFLIIRRISTTKAVHLLGSKRSEKIIRFEEVLR